LNVTTVVYLVSVVFLCGQFIWAIGPNWFYCLVVRHRVTDTLVIATTKR
jgi:hypothetical protein